MCTWVCTYFNVLCDIIPVYGIVLLHSIIYLKNLQELTLNIWSKNASRNFEQKFLKTATIILLSNIEDLDIMQFKNTNGHLVQIHS